MVLLNESPQFQHNGQIDVFLFGRTSYCSGILASMSGINYNGECLYVEA